MIVIFSSSAPREQRQSIPDQGVDLDAVNVVELLQAGLDLGLVGADVNDEDQSVVLLHLLHCALGVKRVNDDAVSIKTGLVRNGLAHVLGRPRKDQGLGSVEGRRRASLDILARVNLEADALVPVKGEDTCLYAMPQL